MRRRQRKRRGRDAMAEGDEWMDRKSINQSKNGNTLYPISRNGGRAWATSAAAGHAGR